MLGIKTHRVLVPALVLFCSAAACRKNPAEQTAAAQTPPAARSRGTPPAPPKPMPAELPDVLARVNGQPVTKVDFDRLIKNMEAGRGPIPAERRDEVLRGGARSADHLQRAEAGSRDAEVRGRRRRRRRPGRAMQKQFPTQAEFDKALSRPEHHRRTAQGRRARRHGHQQDDGSGSRRRRRGHRRRREGLLRQEPRQVRAAGIGPRQPHPDHDQGRGRGDQEGGARQDRRRAEAGQGGRGFRGARQGEFAGRQRLAGGRPRVLPARPDGAGVRSGGLRAEARRDQRRRHHPVRLSTSSS